MNRQNRLSLGERDRIPLTLRLLLCAGLMLSCSRREQDLSAPASKKITIATELNRGWSAGAGKEDTAIDKAKQENTDTDAFLLGAYAAKWAFYFQMAHPEVELPKELTDSYAEEAQGYYSQWRKLAVKLRISDKQLAEQVSSANPKQFLDWVAQFEREHPQKH